MPSSNTPEIKQPSLASLLRAAGKGETLLTYHRDDYVTTYALRLNMKVSTKRGRVVMNDDHVMSDVTQITVIEPCPKPKKISTQETS